MLIIGCGYIGQALARRYLARGDSVTGVVRTPASAEVLQHLGIRPLVLDLDGDWPQTIETQGERIFYLAPPPEEGDQDPRVRRLVKVFGVQGQPARLVYMSTTGVYGDCQGDWVDETRPIRPQVPRAKRRADAEQVLGEWSRGSGSDLVILRVAGFYGPGRLPLERIRQGLPVVREDESPYSNRIHAEDLVEVCLAAMARGGSGEVYNVSDGQPTSMTDYFYRVADLAGLPRPPAIGLAEAAGRLSPGMLSYMRESRRLSNRKLRENLGVRLRYPTLDQGLPSCFAG